jgi:hypothetical protein
MDAIVARIRVWPKLIVCIVSMNDAHGLPELRDRLVRVDPRIIKRISLSFPSGLVVWPKVKHYFRHTAAR